MKGLGCVDEEARRVLVVFSGFRVYGVRMRRQGGFWRWV
jgi:hypothetical protein